MPSDERNRVRAADRSGVVSRVHGDSRAEHVIGASSVSEEEESSLVPIMTITDFDTVVHTWTPPPPRWSAAAIASGSTEVAPAGNVNHYQLSQS